MPCADAAIGWQPAAPSARKDIGLKIAIIGWGYLVWDPRGLDIELPWHPDGPRLPIEFARFTNSPRLVPVLVEGAPLQPALWAMSRKQSVPAVVGDFAFRAGVRLEDIGYWSPDEGMRRATGFAAPIARWVAERGFDGAVWRALGPNLPDRRPGIPSEQVRLEFLRELVSTGRAHDAREYFERMPPQIHTPFQELVQREFGWSNQRPVNVA